MKRLIGLILFLALLPVSAFNVLLILFLLRDVDSYKALIIFVPTMLLLVGLQKTFLRMYREEKPNHPAAQGKPQTIRCHCCGGRNEVTGIRPGTCRYCFVRLRWPK